MRFSAILISTILFLGATGCQKHGECIHSKSLLGKITCNAPLNIESTWVGCFGGGTETIKISKSCGGLHYTFVASDGSTKSGNFSPEAQKQYEIMEAAGKAWTDENTCTTVTNYTLKTGNSSIKFTDKSCGFKEYQKLKELL